MLPVKMMQGDYVLDGGIAAGATSRVYAAHERSTGHRVAIKVLDRSWCVQADVVARFLNEAQSLAVVTHPHVVRVLAVGETLDGEPYMVLEWLPCTLADCLTDGPPPVFAALRIAEQLASGLCAMHAAGLVHRDLKPSNVLLDQRDLTTASAKLADLGLAKLAPTTGQPRSSTRLYVSTASDAALGTWEYMAPEQWMNAKTVEGRADVYSLGVLLFQLLTGRLPFVAEDPQELMYQHLFEPPPLHLLDSAVHDLLACMLLKRAADRPTAAQAVVEFQGLVHFRG